MDKNQLPLKTKAQRYYLGAFKYILKLNVITNQCP